MVLPMGLPLQVFSKITCLHLRYKHFLSLWVTYYFWIIYHSWMCLQLEPRREHTDGDRSGTSAYTMHCKAASQVWQWRGWRGKLSSWCHHSDLIWAGDEDCSPFPLCVSKKVSFVLWMCNEVCGGSLSFILVITETDFKFSMVFYYCWNYSFFWHRRIQSWKFELLKLK